MEALNQVTSHVLSKDAIAPRHDWTREQIHALYGMPFGDLISTARRIFETHFDPNEIQLSRLLSIKTGSCPENCTYCNQSAHHKTGLKKEPLMDREKVLQAAKKAKADGASRFCMGAAWRGPRDDDLEEVAEMVKEVKALGLETCVTLGMLKPHQAERLKEAGLDFYNHNIDTSPEFYPKVVTTRTFQDRLDTLSHVREAGIKVCCGGILGLGETAEDRISMLMALANMNPHPESVPINFLVRFSGTPLATEDEVDTFDFLRTVAIARIVMPKSYIRLSAGRESKSEEFQAFCHYVGANSIFYGERYLTSDVKPQKEDQALFEKLGLRGV